MPARQSCTTMPPDERPPSRSMMLNSLSKAPSNATIFWMSALVEASEISSSSPSGAMSAQQPNASRRAIPDNLALVLEYLDQPTKTARRDEHVGLHRFRSSGQQGAEQLQREVANVEMLLAEQAEQRLQRLVAAEEAVGVA